MENSIIIYVDYGEVKVDIKNIMKKRNISRTQLAKRTGLHHQIIDRYYTGEIVRFDKDVLAKFCYILNCTLDEIIHYEKPKKEDIESK